MPTHKAIHIAKSLKKANRPSQTCQKVCLCQRTLQNVKNNEMATMAKKHRGFGGKLKI